MATDRLHPLHEALTRLDAVWSDAGDTGGLSRSQLVAANDAIGLLRRRLDALHAATRRRDRPRVAAGAGR